MYADHGLSKALQIGKVLFPLWPTTLLTMNSAQPWIWCLLRFFYIWTRNSWSHSRGAFSSAQLITWLSILSKTRKLEKVQVKPQFNFQEMEICCLPNSKNSLVFYVSCLYVCISLQRAQLPQFWSYRSYSYVQGLWEMGPLRAHYDGFQERVNSAFPFSGFRFRRKKKC